MESEVTESAGFYRFLAWLEVNKQRVVYGVVAALVIAVIVWFVVWRREQARIQAGEAFSHVFVSQVTGMSPPEGAATAYLKMASEYSDSNAAARARLLAAANLFTQGKFAEAQTQFEKFVREHRQSPFVGQAQFGVAASLDAQGKTNEAASAYKTLIDRRSAESVLPQAKFALARIYAGQGNPEAAYSLYEGLATDERFSSIGAEAAMRAEELRTKHPELAPKPQTPAISPAMSTPVIVTNTAPAPATNQ